MQPFLSTSHRETNSTTIRLKTCMTRASVGIRVVRRRSPADGTTFHPPSRPQIFWKMPTMIFSKARRSWEFAKNLWKLLVLKCKSQWSRHGLAARQLELHGRRQERVGAMRPSQRGVHLQSGGTAVRAHGAGRQQLGRALACPGWQGGLRGSLGSLKAMYLNDLPVGKVGSR